MFAHYCCEFTSIINDLNRIYRLGIFVRNTHIYLSIVQRKLFLPIMILRNFQQNLVILHFFKISFAHSCNAHPSRMCVVHTPSMAICNITGPAHVRRACDVGGTLSAP